MKAEWLPKAKHSKTLDPEVAALSKIQDGAYELVRACLIKYVDDSSYSEVQKILDVVRLHDAIMASWNEFAGEWDIDI